MAFLDFDGLTKTFPGVRALDGVSFGVDAGSVHALCGENGAGKSTLLKILSGVYVADQGGISVDGVRQGYSTAKDALEAGIAVIYQELNDVQDLNVAENIWLGHVPSRFGFVLKGELWGKTREVLERVGLDISPGTKLRDLSLAQRQMVEIAKALSHHARVIAFDEPTSSLSSREVERLFEIIAELKTAGKAILYVSHRMDEIFRVCDAATVLRDGQHVETFATLQGIDASVIINRMVGREIADVFGYRERAVGDVVLAGSGVVGKGLTEACSVTVRAGEIVGIFGLVGAGRTEFLKAVYEGSGEVEVCGERVKGRGPLASIRAGLVLCPEDRKKEGIIPMLSVAENVNLSVRREHALAGVVLDKRRGRDVASRAIEQFRVKTPTPMTPIRNLSGGNQQKVILGRWLSEDVKVILLDEPTRGIDVGAKSEIYGIIQDLAEQGVGVLLVSSELPEVMGISDRIIVMEGGRMVGEVSRAEATEERLLGMALPHGEVAV